MDMNMELNEETLPVIDEADLVYGAKIAPIFEGTYAVKATLGKNGVKYDETKKAYTVHAENKIIKALKVFDPKVGHLVKGDEVENADKIFFNNDGSGKGIHDFFRISANNRPGITKAQQFLKNAGDIDYNKYTKPSQLAAALESALKQEPDNLKLNGRWRASAETGEVVDGKKKYENRTGAKNFPLKQDGTISHVVELAGEQVAAQFEVLEYGELTDKDVK